MSYSLSQLSTASFEHLVNALALRVLGAGHTSFGPGSDGGRDGFFQGDAPYPSESDRWSGRWYIQSKFHAPHLSANEQRWILGEIRKEITAFKDPDRDRAWPDNWIIATNVNVSAAPSKGTFDRARLAVAKARPKLRNRFHIWGGQKIIELLNQFPDVRDAYGHFLTPGHVLSDLRAYFTDGRADIDDIIRALVVTQFEEHQHTKLEQAGSDSDTRPGIHKLFIDLPVHAPQHDFNSYACATLTQAAANSHRLTGKESNDVDWNAWRRHPSRARVAFVRGGPGQGKSTIGQYFSQIQRAALIIQDKDLIVNHSIRALAEEVRTAAIAKRLWPAAPRIPLYIELKHYAQWYGSQNKSSPLGILTYMTQFLTQLIEQQVQVGTLTRALNSGSWFAAFDGLDEVPSDIKDDIARQVCHFIDEVAIRAKCDLLSLCTSRPQGYAGQFAEIDGPELSLTHLSPDQAIECAKPVLAIGRSSAEARRAEATLVAAAKSPAVGELMRTPLQAHIMAVVVRDGNKPPERRWQLFSNFYEVIRRREANKDLSDERVARLLREQGQLLRTVHNRVGFVLHAAAETHTGAITSLPISDFESLVRQTVAQMSDGNVNSTVTSLVETAKDRLVLVNTPDDGAHVRFDVRQLQEFFAAEFIYDAVSAHDLRDRLELIAGDSHWREVMHFLLSALVENRRVTELDVAVNVLLGLDEGDPATEERALARRMGRGALLASRLLEEGVLEQDRRFRGLFRRCLVPLLGCVVFDHEHNLSNIRQENSRQWTIEMLIEHLREADSSESIGAAIMLGAMVDDSHDKANVVRELILQKGSPFVMAVVKGVSSMLSENERPALWVMRLAWTELTAPSWNQLPAKSLRICLNMLTRSEGDWNRFASATALSPGLNDLVKRILSDSRGREEGATEARDFGGVVANYFVGDWTVKVAQSPSDASLPDLSSWGFFELVHLMYSFGKRRTKAVFERTCEILSQCKHRALSVVPPIARACFPALDRGVNPVALLKASRSIGDVEFETALDSRSLAGQSLRRWAVSFRITETSGSGSWRDFVMELLSVALIIGYDHFGHRKEGLQLSSTRVDVQETLADAVSAQPAILLGFPHLIGRVLRDVGVHRARVLEALRAVARHHYREVSAAYGFHSSSEAVGFLLEMPSDACLLPYIVQCLVLEGQHWPYGTWESDSSTAQRAQKLVDEFALDFTQLVRIADSDTASVDERCSAAILAAMHRDGGLRVAVDRTALLLQGVSTRGASFVEEVCFVLRHFGSDDASGLRMFVAQLLHAVRSDFESRAQVESLLASWRELSKAPLSKANVAAQWLR